LFWNDEILNTLALEREGLLRPYSSATTNTLPATARSPQGTWYALATEARVLVVNTNQVAEARLPKSIDDLSDPQWYERTAIVKPLTGLSATHAACLFQVLGDTRAQELFRAIKRNARIVASDREVVSAVAAGQVAFGLTNSSDAIAELTAGAPVTIVYPDQADGQLGTLYIPMTVALVKDSPDAEPAERLLDYLLSTAVARRLADGPSALVPLKTGVAASDRVKTPAQVRAMNADFPAAAEDWDTASKFLHEEFAAP
jgi:iron(III) transport system substrate-binding protein